MHNTLENKYYKTQDAFSEHILITLKRLSIQRLLSFENINSSKVESLKKHFHILL